MSCIHDMHIVCLNPEQVKTSRCIAADRHDMSPEQRLLKLMLLWRARSRIATLPPNAAVKKPPVAMTSARRNTMMEACT